MEYQGSDKIFQEEPKAGDTEREPFDPEKQRQDAYQDYMDQYAEQEKTGKSIWADKEDFGIFWNLDVADLEAHMDKTDTLKFLYVYDSKNAIQGD